MRWRRNRASADDGRRTARTTDELIRQIADDKARRRFAPRPAELEVPRTVFMSVVDDVAAHFSEAGWRYARSGPHLGRRQGDLSAKLAFVSNRLNVAGELVGLWVDVHLSDFAMGRWRKEVGGSLTRGSAVADRHLGHLLDPPLWLEWNLADPAVRPRATGDVVKTLEDAALPWIESMRRLLDADTPDPTQLAGQVTEVTLIEYQVRAGRLDEAAAVVRAAVDRSHERAQAFFTKSLAEFRRDGLPSEVPAGGSALLAYAVVRFDLPVSA